jgi:hypothetical protein
VLVVELVIMAGLPLRMEEEVVAVEPLLNPL